MSPSGLRVLKVSRSDGHRARAVRLHVHDCPMTCVGQMLVSTPCAAPTVKRKSNDHRSNILLTSHGSVKQATCTFLKKTH